MEKKRGGLKRVKWQIHWIITAKMLQVKYYTEFNIKLDAFTAIFSESIKLAKDTKRKQLQVSKQKEREVRKNCPKEGKSRDE